MEDARRFIEGGPCARHPRHHRTGGEPHVRPSIPGSRPPATPPKGPRERNFYVWADDDQGYQGTRIISSIPRESNWTYDPVAAWPVFLARFYSHQRT